MQARRRETFSFCAVPSQWISRMNRILTRLRVVEHGWKWRWRGGGRNERYWKRRKILNWRKRKWSVAGFIGTMKRRGKDTVEFKSNADVGARITFQSLRLVSTSCSFWCRVVCHSLSKNLLPVSPYPSATNLSGSKFVYDRERATKRKRMNHIRDGLVEKRKERHDDLLVRRHSTLLRSLSFTAKYKPEPFEALGKKKQCYQGERIVEVEQKVKQWQQLHRDFYSTIFRSADSTGESRCFR